MDIKASFLNLRGAKGRGDIICYRVKKGGVIHYFEVATNLLLNSSSSQRVHFMKYTQTDKKGKITTFTWVFPLTVEMKKSLFMGYMKAARARWKIENETFNTLKNQVYNFEHNFGHGEKFLASNLALLMFLAFTIDQIQQLRGKIFQLILAQLRTKIKLWETLRAVFKILKVPDMKTAFFNIIQLFNLKIE